VDARPPGAVPLDALLAGARAQSPATLGTSTRRREPAHRIADLVLPGDTAAQLRELCDRVVHRDLVRGAWGFAATHTRGSGATALFAGPSGTGKTMAADAVAGELGVGLYTIDLATIVSKYIGETEKNLGAVFAAARDCEAVLFFDEADALFGKRSEVRDSHDRYANIETSYLLQQLEEHDGVAILATNLPRNMDDAFVRRLSFTVHFPFPDEDARRRIWSAVWPSAAPLAPDLALDALAARFPLSGGNISNVALAAAFRAAAAGRPVGTDDLLHGIRREYQKLGKVLHPDELALEAGGADGGDRARSS
jgi:SpoVK/Ycf46/Vps4 family AAA+-type ATPase